MRYQGRAPEIQPTGSRTDRETKTRDTTTERATKEETGKDMKEDIENKIPIDQDPQKVHQEQNHQEGGTHTEMKTEKGSKETEEVIEEKTKQQRTRTENQTQETGEMTEREDQRTRHTEGTTSEDMTEDRRGPAAKNRKHIEKTHRKNP